MAEENLGEGFNQCDEERFEASSQATRVRIAEHCHLSLNKNKMTIKKIKNFHLHYSFT